LDEVANPADGAYYIESLTLQLAERSLALFKQLEAGGGFLKQLREHTIQKKIKESAASEQRLFDQCRQVLVGINSHQHKREPVEGGLKSDLFSSKKKGKTLIEPLLLKRLARNMEQIPQADE
jgi:methylmalonyl-CoA mutase